jgi:hypothetical protein
MESEAGSRDFSMAGAAPVGKQSRKTALPNTSTNVLILEGGKFEIKKLTTAVS